MNFKTYTFTYVGRNTHTHTKSDAFQHNSETHNSRVSQSHPTPRKNPGAFSSLLQKMVGGWVGSQETKKPKLSTWHTIKEQRILNALFLALNISTFITNLGSETTFSSAVTTR